MAVDPMTLILAIMLSVNLSTTQLSLRRFQLKRPQELPHGKTSYAIPRLSFATNSVCQPLLRGGRRSLSGKLCGRENYTI
ncbi:hypothetical protein GYMLUDRAFT_49326 [Collybiopsis luxurians FD-317 M1]|uniref:Secreted protein n=1 Tax=Collybiopsis luxurians FD-317 M1 TaxID=944289 RepID=A0A0D0CEM9_9AGAR|nr:hypothetical protein GYMLUDRAFT_49326 [Collybiopsis luxurians FD-317 M1]